MIMTGNALQGCSLEKGERKSAWSNGLKRGLEYTCINRLPA